MTTLPAIDALKRRLIDWKSQFKAITIQVVKGYEAELADLVTEDQLMKGVDNMGQPIRPKYTPFTVRIKKEKGQPFDRVTLKDEGDFHKSVDVRFGTESTEWIFVFYATDSKVAKLEAKYGKDLLGLNELSLEEFNDIIRDELITTIQKAF